MKDSLNNWLLDSDPSIKWQVMKFLGFDEKAIQEERNKIEQEGWGKQILDEQNENGSWGEGMYSPKYTSTTYSLLLLKRLGINRSNPQGQKGAQLLFQGLQKDNGINFSIKSNARGETCITGIIFTLLSYFEIIDPRLEKMLLYLETNQMHDGGWNCRYPREATHSSFNTTMLVLEGLQLYREKLIACKKNTGKIAEMEARGREFLLQHKLYKSHRTGAIVRQDFLHFPFPFHWRYDLLTALDYFQANNFPYDERLEDAIAYVKSKSKNGYVKNYKGQSGKIWFTMEIIGMNSKYNTLRWQRILKWWKDITE